MIYFDNSATTHPKPQSVQAAVNRAVSMYSANPGRGGHRLSMTASQQLYDSRAEVASFFGVKDPSSLVFTQNCTMSLNTVIKGVVKGGDHIVISSLEHNASFRPVNKLKEIGVTYSVAQVYENDGDRTLESFRAAINDRTRLIVCTHASNVTGVKLPVERICAMAHQYGVLTCVDAAQTAGVIPIDLSQSSIDYLCLAGHKSLYGPMGTGALIINCDTIPDSLIEGGTGSNSESPEQPSVIPDRFESGTCNLPGIIGMAQGVRFVKSRGVERIYAREMNHIRRIYSRFSRLENVILYTDYPEDYSYLPVLSFNIDGMDSETVSQKLSDRFNIATRAGLHCAPLAHKSVGTLETGTVRVSPSVFTTDYDVNSLINAVTFLSQNNK